jgi:hypothetical protein
MQKEAGQDNQPLNISCSCCLSNDEGRDDKGDDSHELYEDIH